MLWTLAGIAAVLILLGIALQIAIARNGPAVLSTVDRLAGGTGGAALKATIATGEHPQQKVIVWGPELRDPADAPLPVIVFAHGGSWRNGNPVDYGFIARAFVPNGFIVVLVGYRLGEEGVHPAMLEDTARAITWTHQEIDDYGGDPNRIVLAGHSAGAYNVVMTALEERWLEPRGVPGDAIKGIIGLAGPYDFVPFTSDSTIASFGHVKTPETTQPIRYVRGDAPQMLLIHGEKDTLVKPRNTRALANALKDAGGHAITVFPASMTHNDPLIALAAPWRRSSDIVDLTAGFAQAVSLDATNRQETSVSVQTETR